MAVADWRCPALAQRSPGDRGCCRLVVRHTFLDVVDDGDDDAQPEQVLRARTDPLMRRARYDDEKDEVEPSELPLSVSRTFSDCSTSSEVAASHHVSEGSTPPESPDSASAPSMQGVAAATGPAKCDKRTTLMLRNLPNNYNRDMLLEMLDAEGFADCYDFVYLPIDFTRRSGLGYAFVNLVRQDLVPRFREIFDGYNKWVLPTAKVCEVTWSNPHQGLKANVKRYRNSPVMHPSVPDEFKPCIFKEGVRIPFPEPNRTLCKPHKRA